MFNSKDLRKKFGWTPIKTYQKLKALEEKGLVVRLWRGYYIVNPRLMPRIPMLQVIDSYLKENYYLGLYSAMMYWKITDKVVHTHQVITNQKYLSGKKLEIPGLKANFIYIKENMFFGAIKAPYQGILVKISDLEKTIIDSIYYLGKHVTVEDVTTAIHLAEKKLKPEKLATYLEKINSPTLNQRTGYLLEKLLNIDLTKITNKLKINNKYIKLDPTTQNIQHEKNKKWKIIVNKKIQ